MDKLKPTESNTVTGDSFYNRDVERRLVGGRVESGDHQILTGQRRMGKSSLAREIGRSLLEEKGDIWDYVFVDIQSCSSGAELIARLAEEINKQPDFKNRIKSWIETTLKRTIDRVEEISAGEVSLKLREYLNAGNWQIKGRELLHEIESSDKRTLLVLDEFPDLINKIERNEGVKGVETLLDWLRSEIQATVPNKKISIILSGSIGLEPVLQRLKLTDKINNLSIYRLKPWERTVAKNCFNALANYRKVEVDDDVFEYYLDQLGIYIPQHIQQCWARLDEYLQEEGKTSASKADAEYVFQQIIMRSDSDRMICHYEHRLEETLGEQYYKSAIRLLDQMCNGDSLTIENSKQYIQEAEDDVCVHYILGVLVHDGYLDNKGNSWIFPDSLLRKWWQKRSNFRQPV